MKSFFFTGTDTGVGKTLVCGGLARALHRRGTRVGVFKPFESGCETKKDTLLPADALFLMEQSGSRTDIGHICPYRFREPLAPGVAAEREGVRVSLEKVCDIFLALERQHDVVLVEGAGGLMVPVAGARLMLDVVRMLDIPLVIVARLGLGTINHTLLTVQRAHSGGLTVAGIVLNQTSRTTGIAEETNPAVIERIAGAPLLGLMPYVEQDKRNDGDYLADCVREHIRFPC